MGIAAIFWDRDGTLIKDPGYLRDPKQIELLAGAVPAIRRLTAKGFENIIVTNQSGVARGLLDEATLTTIHQKLCERFASGNACIDAIYHCPYLEGEQAVIEAYRRDSDLRKPKPGMLLKASSERNIDLKASWSIGDSLRDAQAGKAAGCRTILLCVDGSDEAAADDSVDFVAKSLAEAVNIVLEHTPHETKEKSVGDKATNGDSSALLGEILSFLKMADRRSRTQDFSLGQLMGAILQIMALAALVWAIFGMGEVYHTRPT